MRNHFILMLLLILMVSSMSFGQTNIEYPIEVFRIKDNQDNWMDSVRISVTTNTFTGTASWLYVKVNNLNEAGAMQYRVKESSQVTFGAWQTCVPDFTEFPKDDAYGGLNGGFGTTEFASPISGLGSNATYDVEFRFDYPFGTESAGYRILDLALWLTNSKSETNQIANGRTDITGEFWNGPFDGDPNKAYYSNEGKDLWLGNKGPLLQDTKGKIIQASCSDCHAINGFDLQYFNYSDKSIIARSNFHGLSRVEGEKIAQYIRDLSDVGIDRSDNGRPWQPPFQPGPDADSDGYEWAAGEGLENVLESDSDMIEGLFGSSNPDTSAIRTALDNFEGTTNIRTQKLSVQFPDWNEWLPVEHPKDLPAYLLTTAEYQTLETAYTALKAAVDTNPKVQALNSEAPEFINDIYNNNGLFQAFGEFAVAFHDVLDKSRTISFPNSPLWAENFTSSERERFKKSLSHWYSIKLFEIIHLYSLYDIMSFDPTNGFQNIDDAEEGAFQWPTREWAVFQNAAHIISANRGSSYFSTDLTSTARRKGIYLSSIWYQLQLTLTPGLRNGGAVAPNDFAYNLQHIHKLSDSTGIQEPARFLQNYIKTAEQRNNGLAPTNTSGIVGWNMRELSPWRLYSNRVGNTAVLDELGDDLRNKVHEVFYDEVADILNSFGDNWPRTTIDFAPRTDFHLEARDSRPVNGVHFPEAPNDCIFMDRRESGGCTDANDAVEIDAIYTLLYLFQQNGNVSCDVFNKLRGWADDRWDFEDWPICVIEPTNHWTFNGNLNDITGDADGVAVGGVMTTGANQVEGTASLILNGVDDLVELDYAELKDNFTDYSITAWFNSDQADATTDYQYIFEEGGTTNGIGLRLHQDTLEAGVAEGGAAHLIKHKIVENTWYFAAITYDNGDFKLYVNDENEPIETISTGFGALNGHANNSGIGSKAAAAFGGNPSAPFFDGYIDDVRIYDGTALTDEQIQAIYAEVDTLKTISVTKGSGDGEYRTGQTADGILGNYIADSAFVNWKGDSTYLTDPFNQLTSVLIPDQNIDVEAEYTAVADTLFIRFGSSLFTQLSNSTHNSLIAPNKIVPIEADDFSATGWYFDRWRLEDPVTETPLSETDPLYDNIDDINNPNTTFTMPTSGDVRVRALFFQESAKVFVKLVRGTIVENGLDSGYFDPGTVINIEARDFSLFGFTFNEWTGDISYLGDASARETTLDLTGLLGGSSIEVTSISPPHYSYSLLNGTGEIDSEIIPKDTLLFAAETIDITADASIPGWSFDEWIVIGGGTLSDPISSPTNTLTMPSANTTLIATRTRDYWVIVDDGSGPDTTVTVPGTLVNISTSAMSGSLCFDYWAGDSLQLADFNSASTSFTMPYTNVAVNAVYGSCGTTPIPDATFIWAFDTDFDDTEQGLVGTPSSNAQLSDVEVVVGDSSLLLDGTGDRVRIDDNLLEDSFTDYTISAWFNAGDADATTGYQVIFEEGGANSGIGLRLFEDSIQAGVTEGSVDYLVSHKIVEDTWYLATLTYEDGELSLYINDNSSPVGTVSTGFGTLANQANSACIGGKNGATFGNNPSGGLNFTGYIDDVRIFEETVLTPAEIGALYSVGDTGARKAGNKEVVAEKLEDHKIMVYPNPVASILNITGLQPDAPVAIFSIHGRKVYEGKGVSKVDLSNLQKGIYLMHLNGKVLKILKN